MLASLITMVMLKMEKAKVKKKMIRMTVKMMRAGIMSVIRVCTVLISSIPPPDCPTPTP